MSGGRKPSSPSRRPIAASTVRAGAKKPAPSSDAEGEAAPRMPIVEVFGPSERRGRRAATASPPPRAASVAPATIPPTIATMRGRITSLEAELAVMQRDRDADADTIGQMLARVAEREERLHAVVARAGKAEAQVAALKTEIEELQSWGTGRVGAANDKSVETEERVLAAEERTSEMARRIESQRSQLTELEAQVRAAEVRATQAEDALRSAKGRAVELVERVDAMQGEMTLLETKVRASEARVREAEGNFAGAEKHAADVAATMTQLQRSAHEARDALSIADGRSRELEGELGDARAELDVARARIEVERRKTDSVNAELQRAQASEKELRVQVAELSARAHELDEVRARASSLERACGELEVTLAKNAHDRAEAEATQRAEHERAFARARLEFESTVKALERQREESRAALVASEVRVEDTRAEVDDVRRAFSAVNERLAMSTVEREALLDDSARLRADLAAADAHAASIASLLAGTEVAVAQGEGLLAELEQREKELAALRDRTLHATRGFIDRMAAVSRAVATMPVREQASTTIAVAKKATTPPESNPSEIPEPRLKQRQRGTSKRRR